MLRTLFSIDAWQELWHSINKNKLRTTLTLIGVAWGMFLYILLLGLAQGMENGFVKEFDGIASNTVFIWGGQTTKPYDGFPRGRRIQLEVEDVDYLKNRGFGIKQVIPRNSLGNFGTPPSIVSKGLKSDTYQVNGDLPEYSNLQKVEISKGRFLNEMDLEQKRKVAVIGEKIYNDLFESDETPIGEFIQIAGIYFEVVGVYQKDGAGFGGDDEIYTPFTTFQSLFNQGNKIAYLAVTGNDEVETKSMENQCKALLKKKYNIAPNDDEAISAFNLGAMFGSVQGFLTGMQILTISVGILTILAGVIAISNILLITVKERTKEIGIRRALGAKPSEIRTQILMESVVLTLFAGLCGFIFATFILYLLSTAPPSENFPFYNPTVSPMSIFYALTIMVSLGLLVGLIPAQRAISIKPIEALRTG